MALSSDPRMRAKQLANLKPKKKGEKAFPNAGRHKSIFTNIINSMEDEVGSVPSREDIMRCLFFCLSAGEEALKRWVTDKEKPMMVRVCAKEVLSEKGFEAIGRILDRVVGRTIDVTTNGKDIKQEQLIVEVIDDKSQVRIEAEE